MPWTAGDTNTFGDDDKENSNNPVCYERFVTHLGVVFMNSDKPDDVPERCLSAIDAVIDCDLPVGECVEDELSNSRGLWFYYIVDKLPELVQAIPGERLQRIADILATVESRGDKDGQDSADSRGTSPVKERSSQGRSYIRYDLARSRSKRRKRV